MALKTALRMAPAEVIDVVKNLGTPWAGWSRVPDGREVVVHAT